MEAYTPRTVYAPRGDYSTASRHAGGRVEPLHFPYRNAFSGRTTSKNHFHFEARPEICWEITATAPNGQEQIVDVVTLVEWMIKDGWERTKQLRIKEKMMPTAMRIAELRDVDGNPLNLDPPKQRFCDYRENDMDEDYPSDPPKFDIMTITSLQQWDVANRPLPPGSHNSGCDVPHKHRNLKHPDDPLGLVADKLGRAIADERRVGGRADGKRLEPVFVNVYSLGHASVMRQLDKGLRFIGCGAFHAGLECHGAEWSFGYNDDDASGLFPSPPKYCEMHDYLESHYIGDTTMTQDEFERWLQFLAQPEYKQEDPLDPAFPQRVPEYGETPAEFFGSELHPTYRYCLMPVTKEAQIGNTFTYVDTSRVWRKDIDPMTGEEMVVRVGWWGDDYDLLSNNCCFLVDHLLKILVGKPLPSWIFSLAKIGDGLAHGLHFIHDAAAEGVHAAIAAIEHTVGGHPKGVRTDQSGGCCCGGRPDPEPAPAPASGRMPPLSYIAP